MDIMQNLSPNNQQELLHSAHLLTGATLGEIAQAFEICVPDNLLKNKGWVGQLIETALGATAKQQAIPDFPELDIELKTIPISAQLTPLETTYITTAPLVNLEQLVFEESPLYHKLKHVLWIPIQGERDIPLANRMIGTPLLWQPSSEQWRLIKQDWFEIMEQITLGRIEYLNAKHGEIIQLRPKAANSQVTTAAIGQDGAVIQTRPRGFYLKTNFTNTLLQEHFL
jgi:DNA mismatch repair protein MutH